MYKELKNIRETSAIKIIFAVSVSAVVFLFWLIYFSNTSSLFGNDLSYLRYVNGFLNFTATIFLSGGFYFIRKRDFKNHKKMMTCAFFASSIFLIFYIIYHFASNSTPFLAKEASIRIVYFFILISHIALSALILPFVLVTFFYSLSGRLAKHKKLARWVFPVWYYVSITGVLIVLMLDTFNPV